MPEESQTVPPQSQGGRGACEARERAAQKPPSSHKAPWGPKVRYHPRVALILPPARPKSCHQDHTVPGAQPLLGLCNYRFLQAGSVL